MKPRRATTQSAELYDEQRRVNQQKRIREGVRSRELTNRELVRLEGEQARLTKILREDRMDG